MNEELPIINIAISPADSEIKAGNETADMLVSVITASFNSEAVIADAIHSVLGQTFSDWEMIIVDDGSTDATVKVVEKFLGDKRIKLHRHSVNMGTVAARNRAIELARGSIIAILDSDDLWMPCKLE